MISRSGTYDGIMPKNMLALKRFGKQEGIEMKFKYTAPGTPQWNSCVEWKFATLYNWACIMLNGKKFFSFLRKAYVNIFLGREREASCCWFKNLVKCAKPQTGIIPIKLSWPIKVLQAFGLDLLKAIQLEPTICTTQRQEKILTKDMTFLHKSYGK